MFAAIPLNNSSSSYLELGYGAGELNPLKAANPGLVYDAREADFVQFLCGEGYSTDNLQHITGRNICCTEAPNGTIWDLNMPSFTLTFQQGTNVTRTFTRTVTNVRSAVSIYKAKVTTPSGLAVKVEPSVLIFNTIGQKQTFKVTATATGYNLILSGSLVWDDGVSQVRSPIVAHGYYFRSL